MMFKVEIWHNEARDSEGRHLGFGGYRPSHARHLSRVFAYSDEVTASGQPLAACERAFVVFNAPPDALSGPDRVLMTLYRARRVRSLSVGDLVVLSGPDLARTAYAVSPIGFTRLRSDPTGR